MSVGSPRSWARAAAAAMTLLFLPTGLPAQGGAAGAGAGVEVYRFGDPAAVGIKGLTLATVPFAARAAVTPWLALEVAGSYARASLVGADDRKLTISGLTDTDVNLAFGLARDRLTLAASFALPTGHAGHTPDEAEVAGAIAADLFPFRVSNWGSGGGAGGSAALALPLPGAALGVNVGYRVAREFQPLADAPIVYRPGDELRVRAALDITVGTAGKASFVATLQRYADDQLEDRNLYRSGNRYQAMASYAFAAGPQASAVLYAGVLRRQTGTFIDGSEGRPAQDLILLGGGVRVPLASRMLLPSVDARIFRSADGVGQGYVAGVGASLELPAGGATFVPSLRGRIGKALIRQGQESGVWGVDIALMVQAGR